MMQDPATFCNTSSGIFLLQQHFEKESQSTIEKSKIAFVQYIKDRQALGKFHNTNISSLTYH
jgi:hypothetical protein